MPYRRFRSDPAAYSSKQLSIDPRTVWTRVGIKIRIQYSGFICSFLNIYTDDLSKLEMVSSLTGCMDKNCSGNASITGLLCRHCYPSSSLEIPVISVVPPRNGFHSRRLRAPSRTFFVEEQSLDAVLVGGGWEAVQRCCATILRGLANE